MKKLGLSYLKEFWNILDIVVLLIALCCIAFNVYCYFEVKKHLDLLFLKPNAYIDFDFLTYWQMIFNAAMAVMAFFAWIKVGSWCWRWWWRRRWWWWWRRWWRWWWLLFIWPLIIFSPSFSNTSVSAEQCHSCPWRWEQVPKTWQGFQWCSSLFSWPSLSWGISCSGLKWSISTPFPTQCWLEAPKNDLWSDKNAII